MLMWDLIREKGAAVHAIAEGVTLAGAAQELNARRIGCVVVLAPDGAVAGMLSERDIVRAVAQRGAACLEEPVANVMTRRVITIQPDESVDDGLARMSDRRIRHLPVVREGRLIGLVSIGDLVRRKIEETQGEAEAMRAYIAAG